MRNKCCFSAVVLGVLTASLTSTPAVSAQTFLNPGTPYLSRNDSPFSPFLDLDGFFLEDFEDGLLNTPGVASTSGGEVLTGPNAQLDSVDGDDGTIDNSGTTGKSFFSFGATSVFTFVFDDAALGDLPTHVGIVWTDVGQKISGLNFGFDDVTLAAFDADGNPIGTTTLTNAGDGSTFSETDEDRFLGVIYDQGISRIELTLSDSIDWEADHLQYGRVPQPGSAAILASVGLALMVRRSRASKAKTALS